MPDYYMSEDDAVGLIGCSASVLRVAADRGQLRAVRSVFTGQVEYHEQDVNRLRRLMNVELANSLREGKRR